MSQPKQNAAPVDDRLYRQVCEFYYDEADLLAGRQYLEWFALLAEDVHYRVGFPEFYEHGLKRQVGIGAPYFDDNHASLKVRVTLLADPTTTTAENPPSAFNYFVTNIRARQAGSEGEIEAATRLLIYRVRASEPTPYLLAARRRDRLRLVDGALRLAGRDVLLNQAIIQSPNMSWLF